MKTKTYDNMVVVNMPREQVATLRRRTHYLMPQMSGPGAARAILRGVDRNRALVVFPAAAQIIWHVYRWFPSVFYRINTHRMRLFPWPSRYLWSGRNPASRARPEHSLVPAMTR